MAWKHQLWARSLPIATTPAQRAVLKCLAEHADQQAGRVFLKNTTIARECSLHMRSVQRALHQLAARNLIRPTGLRGQAVIYQLPDPAALAPTAPAENGAVAATPPSPPAPAQSDTLPPALPPPPAFSPAPSATPARVSEPPRGDTMSPPPRQNVMGGMTPCHGGGGIMSPLYESTVKELLTSLGMGGTNPPSPEGDKPTVFFLFPDGFLVQCQALLFPKAPAGESSGAGEAFADAEGRTGEPFAGAAAAETGVPGQAAAAETGASKEARCDDGGGNDADADEDDGIGVEGWYEIFWGKKKGQCAPPTGRKRRSEGWHSASESLNATGGAKNGRGGQWHCGGEDPGDGDSAGRDSDPPPRPDSASPPGAVGRQSDPERVPFDATPRRDPESPPGDVAAEEWRRACQAARAIERAELPGDVVDPGGEKRALALVYFAELWHKRPFCRDPTDPWSDILAALADACVTRKEDDLRLLQALRHYPDGAYPNTRRPGCPSRLERLIRNHHERRNRSPCAA